MTASLVVRRTVTATSLTAAAVVATAAPAAAHPGHDASMGGWADGLLHPVLGPDHVAAMVAVGVLAALTAQRLPVWSLPTAFIGAMVVGGALGLSGWEMGMVELVIAGSVVVLGVLIALGGRLHLGAWLLPAVGVAGFAHGSAHGLEAPAAAAPVAYVAGFVVATAALHAAGAVVGIGLRRVDLGRILGGAALAAFGTVLVLG
jgi:urease accessory protein